MALYTPTSIQVLDPQKPIFPTEQQSYDAGVQRMYNAKGTSSPTTPTAGVTTGSVPNPGETIAQTYARGQAVLGGLPPLPGATPPPTAADTTAGLLGSPTYQTAVPTIDDYQKEANPEQVRQQQMRLFQDQIDATNQVYDQILNTERLAGQGRLGTSRAMSARGGLLGSDFGEAQRSTTEQFNLGQERGVQAERNAKIGSIMGEMRSAVATELKEKREARQSGYDNYVKYLASADERKANNANLAAGAILAAGLDPATMKPEELAAIGKEAGLSTEEIIYQYQQQKVSKSEADLKTRKTEAEISKIEADIASGKLVSLGEGSMLYNIETGEKVKNPKTSAPSTTSGTGGGATPYSSDLDAVIGSATLLIPSKFGQENFNKQIASARNPQDKLNLVASQVLRGQSADLRNDFANLKTGVSQLDKAIALIDSGVQTGVLEAGAQYAFNAFGKDFDPKLAELRSNVTAAVQPYRNSVTGAAWGTQEEAEYQALFGSNKYAPEELRLRLQTMKDIMVDKQASALNSMVNPLDYYDNQFSTDYNANSNSGGEDISGYSDEDLQRIANGG